MTVIGFTDGLLAGQFGEKMAADLAAVFGEEEIRSDSVIDLADDAGTGIYYISAAQPPDALLLYYLDGSDPITLWEAGDPIPGETDEAEADG